MDEHRKNPVLPYLRLCHAYCEKIKCEVRPFGYKSKLKMLFWIWYKLLYVTMLCRKSHEHMTSYYYDNSLGLSGEHFHFMKKDCFKISFCSDAESKFDLFDFLVSRWKKTHWDQWPITGFLSSLCISWHLSYYLGQSESLRPEFNPGLRKSSSLLSRLFSHTHTSPVLINMHGYLLNFCLAI